jgi:hypothetical protein
MNATYTMAAAAIALRAGRAVAVIIASDIAANALAPTSVCQEV